MPEYDHDQYIAVDWGTTNRRAFLMTADGRVLDTSRDDNGVRSVPSGLFAAEIKSLRARFGDVPIIAAGMVGSTLGWREVPYAFAPADLEKLAAAAVQIVDASAIIVPGVAINDRDHCDVMRGEEVQVLGAAHAGLVPRDALLCQPGTHNKWIWLEASAIVNFTTAMTGEMFALLRDHSILHDMLGGEVTVCSAFRDGIERAATGGDLLSAFFSVRASVLLGRRAAKDAAAYCSGLLIGADVAARGVAKSGTVYLLADDGLGDLFDTAITLLGGHVARVDSQAAFTAGIHHIWNLSK